MLTLDPLVTQALAGNEIWSVRLVSLQIGNTTYRISDHYTNLTIGTDTYLPNGNLLSIDAITNDVETKNDSIEVGLSGIDSVFRKDVLAADSIGGTVSIYRGLINSTTGGFVAAPIKVYEGFIYSIGIVEDVPESLPTAVFGQSTFTIAAEIRSTTFRLQESPGRFTNDESQKQVDNTDKSMEYVAQLNGVNIRFGGTG